MSLILGVKSGDKIFLNDAVMDIVHISEDMLNMQILFNGCRFDLEEHTFMEIAKGVFAAVGIPKTMKWDTLARIAIDAPRSVKILREVHKEYDHNH